MNDDYVIFPTRIGVSGRFRAVAHKGHTLDCDGNIIKEGEVVVHCGVRQETPFGRNKLTTRFFQQALAPAALNGCFVAGKGNTPATEADSVLTSYAGKCSAHVSAVNTYSDTPDANGYIYLRTVFRATFNPGALGGGAVNISEAGIAHGTTSSTTALTPLLSHGLLVNSSGNPASVSLNNDTEYLDLFWEYTRYFKAEQSGTFQIDIDGVMTDYSYTMRPCNWRQQASASNYWWRNDEFAAANITLQCFRPENNGDNPNGAGSPVRPGPIGTIAQYPLGTPPANPQPSTWAIQPQTDPKQRTWKATWTTNSGNVVSGIGAWQVGGNFSPAWQIGFTPKIDKTAEKQLELSITYIMDNAQ